MYIQCNILLAHLLVLWTLFNSAFGDPDPPKEKISTRVILSPVSMWTPFCSEKQLFEPYVIIWSGSEERRFVKGRGPGFIDVRDSKDIFICTNGIAMFYYANTKAMGDILEEGELRWASHYCQLHNPTCGPGTIQPRRTLKAILLIGHPKDYRNPALQIFVSPYFNNGTVFANSTLGWVNLTSYLMVNHKSECIVERGPEKALNRINVNKPNYEDEFEEAAPIKNDQREVFCRFDAARMLAQYREMGDLVNSMKEPLGRVTLTQQNYFDNFIYQKPSKFLGCLKYPAYNQKQNETIQNNYHILDTNFTEITQDDELTPDDRNNTKEIAEYPFWHVVVKGKPRYEWVSINKSPMEDLQTAKKNSSKEIYDEVLEAYLKVKKDSVNQQEIEAASDKEFKAYLEHNLFPFRVEYYDLHAKTLKEGLGIKTGWTEAIKYIESKKLDEYLLKITNASTIASLKAIEKRANPYDYNTGFDYDDARESAMDTFKLMDMSTEQLGKFVSEAEVLKINYFRIRNALRTSNRKLRHAWQLVEKRKKVVFTPTRMPLEDHVISIGNHDPKGAFSSCDYLPGRTETCHQIRPSSDRAYKIYNARVGKGPKWIKDEDAWRGKVLDLIGDIFVKTCPYIPNGIDMATGVNGVVKSYLLKEPNNTGYEKPIRGTRLYAHVAGNLYQEEVYNDTRKTMGENLRRKMKIWDFLISTLQACKKTVTKLTFVKSKDDESKPKILLKKYHSENKTYEFIPTDQMHMVEQVDREYVLNWAIDTNWKMFATVLGSCIRSFNDKVPLIAAHFYSMYVEDFLHPIRQIWMSHRDNPIFKVIFGRYYGNGKSDSWIKNCMEAVYINVEERTYRPLRWLLVNQFSELNFFVSGPMTGSSGAYFEN